MPAAKVITKETIENAAMAFLEKHGESALNARALAGAIGCSTQPIYHAFSGMAELKSVLKDKCQAVFGEYLAREKQDTLFMQCSLSYLRFAKEKPHLFRFLFRGGMASLSALEEFRRQTIMRIRGLGQYSEADAEAFHASAWIYMHGMATILLADPEIWDDDTIRHLLSEQFSALKLYYGGKTNV